MLQPARSRGSGPYRPINASRTALIGMTPNERTHREEVGYDVNRRSKFLILIASALAAVGGVALAGPAGAAQLVTGLRSSGYDDCLGADVTLTSTPASPITAGADSYAEITLRATAHPHSNPDLPVEGTIAFAFAVDQDPMNVPDSAWLVPDPPSNGAAVARLDVGTHQIFARLTVDPKTNSWICPVSDSDPIEVIVTAAPKPPAPVTSPEPPTPATTNTTVSGTPHFTG